MNFAVNVVLNSLSLGQVSIAILREMYKKGLQPNIFPIAGQLDLAAQKKDDDFDKWINSCIQKAHKLHKRSDPVFKLWHLNQSFESISNNQSLFTFYELDSPTEEEVNVVRNQKKVIFSSSYTKGVFDQFGLDNVHFIPLGFDSHNFHLKEKRLIDERITFNLVGKLEKRKNHLKVISTWVKRFGNNPRFFLNCAIFNPFMKHEEQQRLIAQAVNNTRFVNVQFLGFMPTNALYQDYLTNGDVVLGLSGGEGWGLPEFQSVALGKHAIILNCNALKDWATADNSVLVNPSGKLDAYDGQFFIKGQQFNQGNIFDLSEQDLMDSFDKVISRVEKNRVNKSGLELQNKFTYENTTNQILKLLE